MDFFALLLILLLIVSILAMAGYVAYHAIAGPRRPAH
ncbi:Tfp pilus assembly protein PilE [Lewinella aquimaris]|uniref:Tfp pilus assembly protein PilE n=1 Tax=Neolewinella aquimaris TaxID=1835722 RepID=A0A840E057_9BACT|nr:Tfp pilus assembly protein PilE [Neolewinella aquimaris]